ncbi:shikimate dehydrogenase [Ornithinibacillus californiensis]|uniref:shikimate dehydrogenase n=1 Tax=Ornithinibacillus californiensis TaxID=161536 RepID=UPI00064D742C|nr:shikimate dehydrogenase [Ornithinibacillus californiensis]
MEGKLGLVGYPIKHSLSPWIHQRFLENTETIGTYSILEVLENELEQMVQTIRKNSYKGFNVTLPYKQKIIPFLDELDPHAKEVGAVNTVLNRNGKLIGYNTDGIGYLRSLTNHYPAFVEDRQKNVLLLGAGGAARAIYYALNQSGFQFIDIANRTIEKAQSIADLKTPVSKTSVLTLSEAEKNLDKYDLIIQTTNVGMKPNEDEVPIRLEKLQENAIVSDIIYQPIWTKLLKEAKSRGASVHHGHSMLLYQAQYAFEIWFGRLPIITNMDIQLKQLLEG